MPAERSGAAALYRVEKRKSLFPPLFHPFRALLARATAPGARCPAGRFGPRPGQPPVQTAIPVQKAWGKEKQKNDPAARPRGVVPPGRRGQGRRDRGRRGRRVLPALGAAGRGPRPGLFFLFFCQQ